MADEYGVPQPDCAEDYRQFIRRLDYVGMDALELRADTRGIDLLREALFIFEDEFKRRFSDTAAPPAGDG